MQNRPGGISSGVQVRETQTSCIEATTLAMTTPWAKTHKLTQPDAREANSYTRVELRLALFHPPRNIRDAITDHMKKSSNTEKCST